MRVHWENTITFAGTRSSPFEVPLRMHAIFGLMEAACSRATRPEEYQGLFLKLLIMRAPLKSSAGRESSPQHVFCVFDNLPLNCSL